MLSTSLIAVSSSGCAPTKRITFFFSVFCAPQKEEAKKVIICKCLENDVKLLRGATVQKSLKKNKETGFTIESATFVTEKAKYPDIVLGLNGKHQLTNASVAIKIAETLEDFGYKISDSDVRFGLQNVEHKGRLEFYKGILFDGAHNIAGARALKNYLDEFIKQPITMIFGAMRDKDLLEIAELLFQKAEILILTKTDNTRSLETNELLKFVPKEFNLKNVFATETVADAIEKAKDIAWKNNLICVTGSLYLVGEAQKYLKKS